MNKLSAVFLSLACLAGAAHAQPYNNWVSSDGTVWKNGTNEYCWRNSSWTPATAHPDCDGAIAPKKAEVAAPVASAPAAAPVATATPPAAAPVAVAPAKVTFAASAFFDTNKSVLKAEGKAQLDDLLAKLKSVNWDVLVAVGHADSRGSAELNQALSVRRAEAVKAYLLNKGLSQQQVKTDGKGSSMPVADNSTESGRAKNRRVEIEVVGTAK
jgi:OmpA-OmpF porin, OOP family